MNEKMDLFNSKEDEQELIIKIIYDKQSVGFGAELAGFTLKDCDMSKTDYSICNNLTREKYAITSLKNTVNFLSSKFFSTEYIKIASKIIDNKTLKIAKIINSVGIEEVFSKAKIIYSSDYPTIKINSRVYKIINCESSADPCWYDIQEIGHIVDVEISRFGKESTVFVTVNYTKDSTYLNYDEIKGGKWLEERFIPSDQGFPLEIVSTEAIDFIPYIDKLNRIKRISSEILIKEMKKYIPL